MSSMPAPEETVDWPILTGAALAVGLLLSGLKSACQCTCHILDRMPECEVNWIRIGLHLDYTGVRPLVEASLNPKFGPPSLDDMMIRG